MAQATRYNEPFYFHRIVNVGWGGRIGIVNISLISGDPGVVAFIYAAQVGWTELPVPRLNDTFGIGDEIPVSLFSEQGSGGSIFDPEQQGVRSVEAGGADFPSGLANFTILKRVGVDGVVVASSAFTAPPINYLIELKIYSGGIFKVDSILGRYPQITNTGGIEHFAGTRELLMPPHTSIVTHFDENGFI